MEKLLLILLSTLQLNAFCQDSNDRRLKPYYYITESVPIPMLECNMMGKVLDEAIYAAPFKSSFYFVGYKGSDSVIVTFLFFTTSDTISNKYTYYEKYNIPTNPVGKALLNYDLIREEKITSKNRPAVLSADERKYFLMSRYHFENRCYPFYSTKFNTAQFTVSAVTLPVKLRLNNFDFDKNFSLGFAGGAKQRISNYKEHYINYLAALSISTNDLDSFSTRGKVATQPIKNVATFSPALGIVFEFGKAQVGIFGGVDLMSKSNRNKFDWIYHGKPWLSIGFGFSILSKESDKPKDKSEGGAKQTSKE
jgi:hypothetical protein